MLEVFAGMEDMPTTVRAGEEQVVNAAHLQVMLAQDRELRAMPKTMQSQLPALIEQCTTGPQMAHCHTVHLPLGALVCSSRAPCGT